MLAIDNPEVGATIACIANGKSPTLLEQNVGVPLRIIGVGTEVAHFVHVATIGYAGKVEAACLVDEVELPELAVIVLLCHKLGSTTDTIN